MTQLGPYAYAVDKTFPTITRNVTGAVFGDKTRLSRQDILKVQTLYNCLKGNFVFIRKKCAFLIHFNEQWKCFLSLVLYSIQNSNYNKQIKVHRYFHLFRKFLQFVIHYEYILLVKILKQVW